MVIGARMMFNNDMKASDIVEENKVENIQQSLAIQLSIDTRMV